MSLDAWLTIGILILTFSALLATKLPPATVFLGALTLSVTFGLAPTGPQPGRLFQFRCADDWRIVYGRRRYVLNRRHQLVK